MGPLIERSAISTSSSASRSWSVPTKSVWRPRWLCVASGTSSRIRSTSPGSKPASSRRSLARLRTRPCAHGQAVMPVASPDDDVDRLLEELGKAGHVYALLVGGEVHGAVDDGGHDRLRLPAPD